MEQTTTELVQKTRLDLRSTNYISKLHIPLQKGKNKKTPSMRKAVTDACAGFHIPVHERVSSTATCDVLGVKPVTDAP
jgi:hypothetical protein